MIYRELAPYLKERYGSRVQRVSVANFKTCPNRDGTVGTGGCTFCEETGSGFANKFRGRSVKEQMELGKEKARRKYRAKKFMAYFQSFTNTYGPLEELEKAYSEALTGDVVAIDVSTRPDAFPEEVAELLKRISSEKGVDVFVEFGLESMNENTLKWMNRGHSVGEFVDSVLRAKAFGFETVAHVILDLPTDTTEDVIGCAKLLSALGVGGVKMHSLYVTPGTRLAKDYADGKFEPFGAGEYVERAVSFLANLDPGIVVHRLVSTPTDECLWSIGLKSAEAKNMIESRMAELGKVQGSDFGYLNGGAWKKRFSR